MVKKIDQSTLLPVVFNDNEIGLPNNHSNIFKLERVYNDNPNIEHKSYKLLGVYFDEYLSFDKHCSYCTYVLNFPGQFSVSNELVISYP